MRLLSQVGYYSTDLAPFWHDAANEEPKVQQQSALQHAVDEALAICVPCGKHTGSHIL
jgi:hypothetical protein